MLHFCINWTPATPIGPRDAPFSSRSIPLSPSIATHTQSSLCDAKCASATSFLSDASALFHFPYPVSPVFATHTKTAGCVPTIPILELTDPRSFFSFTYELPIFYPLCFDIHASDGRCTPLDFPTFACSNVQTSHQSRPLQLSFVTSLPPYFVASRRASRLLLHCSAHGSSTPRPAFPLRSPLARRDRPRHSRLSAFHRAPPAGWPTLLDRNRLRSR